MKYALTMAFGLIAEHVSAGAEIWLCQFREHP